MKNKMTIKDSEARIMVYLSVVHPTRRSVTKICHTLEMGYGYALQILQSMVSKGWLTKHKRRRNMFYSITATAPLEDAKLLYNTQSLETSLNAFTEAEVSEIEEKEPSSSFCQEKVDELNRDIQLERKGELDDTENEV